jgi:hypothetical protein
MAKPLFLDRGASRVGLGQSPALMPTEMTELIAFLKTLSDGYQP